MEIITGGNTSIFAGSDEITKVYQGSGLIWEKNESPAPAWPDDYFYPNLYFSGNNSGISFWKNSLTSGHTYTLDAHRTDDEGEGGGGFWQIEPKSGSGEVSDGEKNSTTKIIPHNNYQNAWVNVYDGWEIHFNSFGSFDGGTAIAFKSQPVYGGHGCYIASTGINWDNIELAISLIPGDNNSQNNRFGNLVLNCPNLKYICLNIDGSNTGSTLTLTGSTAWTAESMKFTEWYCPGTTFIIEDNSYWRSIIDWDIAAKRNITFKDGNGNIITQ